MKSTLFILAMIISLSCFSQTLSGEEQTKVNNTIRAIKNETQPGDTVKSKSSYYVKVQKTDTIRFHCRATRSFNENPPLIVVDGIEKEIASVNYINPNDIQSIQILKDKKATDLYGDKAKNGVIFITMKCKNGNPPVL